MIQITDKNGVVRGSVASIGDVTDGTLIIDGGAPPPPVKAFNSAFLAGDLVSWYQNVTKPPIAAVDVLDPNGKLLPNLRGPSAHTYVYRLGGVPIPGIDQTSGAAYTTGGHGVYIFKAYDDAGDVIDTEPWTL